MHDAAEPFRWVRDERAPHGSLVVAGRKVHQVCRMGVGRTFQVVRSFPRLPLLDNVIVGAYGAGYGDADAIAALCDGGRFAPEILTDAERGARDTGAQRFTQPRAVGGVERRELRGIEFETLAPNGSLGIARKGGAKDGIVQVAFD